MDHGKTGYKTYVRVVQALRELITSDYPEGGWLPPGREMAKRLGVAHATYRKALTFLNQESLVSSVAQSGYYAVPVHLRVKKIGLIFQDGRISPFVGNLPMLGLVMQTLGAQGYDAQIIQGSSTEQVLESALLYGVKGVLWFQADSEAQDAAQRLTQDTGIPVVLTGNALQEQPDCPTILVTYDRKTSLLKSCHFLVARGHRAILYFGSYETAVALGMAEYLKAEGLDFTEEHCVSDITKTPNKLTRLIKRLEITGILASGGGTLLNFLFGELSNLPEEAQPEVLVGQASILPVLKQRFADIKLIESGGPKGGLTPEPVAAQLLADHLEAGRPLESIQIESCSNLPG